MSTTCPYCAPDSRFCAFCNKARKGPSDDTIECCHCKGQGWTYLKSHDMYIACVPCRFTGRLPKDKWLTHEDKLRFEQLFLDAGYTRALDSDLEQRLSPGWTGNHLISPEGIPVHVREGDGYPRILTNHAIFLEIKALLDTVQDPPWVLVSIQSGTMSSVLTEVSVRIQRKPR